jgi:hypothetical protein
LQCDGGHSPAELFLILIATPGVARSLESSSSNLQ